jgi:hypothetical protein
LDKWCLDKLGEKSEVLDYQQKAARKLRRYRPSGRWDRIRAASGERSPCLREWLRRGILQLKKYWTIILKLEALRTIEEHY